MSVQRISGGSSFEEEFAYSRAVVADGWVFVAGTTGYDYATMRLPTTVAEQAEACLQNIAAALRTAGASLNDVVRVHYIVTDRAWAQELAPITRRHFGTARPAATLLVADLLNPEMLIEIEVTARLP